jgi:paraquat-inducible protein B
MSKKASARVIGVFVLGAVTLLVAGVMIFGSGRFFQKKSKFVLFFDGSVKGLTVGAPVLLQGVQIGSVIDIKVIFNPETLGFQTPVYIEILPESIANAKDMAEARKTYEVKAGTQQAIDLFVQRGLRARLEMQSLVTGKLLISLAFHPGTPVYLAGLDKQYPEIPTIPTEMKELVKKLEELPIQELVEKATHAVTSLDSLVSSPEVKESISALNLALKDMGALVQSLNREVGPLSASLQGTLGDARKLMNNTDGQVTRLTDSLVKTSEAAESALVEAKTLLVNVDEEIIGERAAMRAQLVRTLEELSQAARAIRLLAEFLEQKPDALLRGKQRLGGN